MLFTKHILSTDVSLKKLTLLAHLKKVAILALENFFLQRSTYRKYFSRQADSHKKREFPRHKWSLNIVYKNADIR